MSESLVLCQSRKKSGPLFIEDFLAYKLVFDNKGWKFSFFSFQVKARLQKMGALSPMNIFLRQEIDRMQRVITAVRQTLTDLKLAIDGTIIMSEVNILLFWLFGSFVKFYLSLVVSSSFIFLWKTRESSNDYVDCYRQSLAYKKRSW